VPGAFTGTCHAQVPAYIKAFEQFQDKGVNGIYIVAVNDVFVTKCVALYLCLLVSWLLTRKHRAWKQVLAPNGSGEFFYFAHAYMQLLITFCTDVHFIADDSGVFSNSLGLLFDASPVLGNPRSQVRCLPSPHFAPLIHDHSQSAT
jgi:Redoxin